MNAPHNPEVARSVRTGTFNSNVHDLGVSKLHLIRTVLRRLPPIDAPYEPLLAAGPAREHVVAFRRGVGHITVTSRLALRLDADGGWRGTTITVPDPPDGTQWQDVLSGRATEPGEHDIVGVLAGLSAAYLVAVPV